jgi:hypothetical protein
MPKLGPTNFQAAVRRFALYSLGISDADAEDEAT